jgi:hypothetical protein
MNNALLLSVALVAALTAIVSTINMQCGPSDSERRPLRLRLRDLLIGWHPMWAVRLERSNPYPVCRIISLREAAEIAREQTVDSRAARMAEHVCSGNKVSNLTYYAAVLGDADWVALYGCRRHSRRLEKINRAEFKDTQFVDDGDALKRYWEGEPIYTKVHMCRRDLHRRIRQLTTADQR